MSSFYGVKVKNLLRQYRDYLSDFKSWDQKAHAKQWLLYPENLGEQLSIDETSLSHGELYTIITNKAAKGKKGAIVAIVAGTKAETVISVLQQIPERLRKKVTEITLDMAGNMELICKRCFPGAIRVTDRFHVQKLATEALQEMRIKHRWEAMDIENEAIEQSKKTGHPFHPEVLHNGDTVKQLLARGRYVLYKKPADWTQSQKDRAELLFERFPDLKTAYGLSMGLSQLFENTKNKVFALAKLAKWHERVRQTGFKAFNTIARSIQNHYQTILNYFDRRSTNASAESFNAKIKAFRAQFRGVKNIEFFLFRLTQLYA
ncbi:ISAon1 family transposase [Pedobacter sp. PACM 27299]|uniref:ISAon1 family transposase n=1 Tax=Pedobacter sp. PACM 27299 TaxID=1727164 RepID=UPI0012FBEB41